MHKATRRIIIFSDKYPFLGPIFWMLSIQYLITTFFVTAAWPVTYDLKNNYISDLGNTVCGTYGGLYVCSPLHILMNLSFVVFGVTMAAGAGLIYREFERTVLSRIGFILMALAGVGTIVVGLFPENTVTILHQTGASLGLGVGSLSIVILALGLKEVGAGFRVYSFASGVLSLLAFGMFATHHFLGIGRGGMERLASYPFTVWLIAFGLYMSAVRVRARHAKK